MLRIIFFSLMLGMTSLAASQEVTTLPLSEICEHRLTQFQGQFDKEALRKACQKVTVFDGCTSVRGAPLFHYERSGYHKSQQKILVFSLIHGDEFLAGSVGRYWMERLEKIDPRNSWRVLPILNPDGLDQKTRTNANKIDLNRNFPTKDWNDLALNYWKKQTSSNPRRFPGKSAASEPEILCALKHIQDFQPDFVVSIHTPLKVLDYDGPKVQPPRFDYLPWKSLGHFPGSLGRYMWFERQIPVLTMELRNDLPKTEQPFSDLQDIIGYLVSLELAKKKPSSLTGPAIEKMNSEAEIHTPTNIVQ